MTPWVTRTGDERNAYHTDRDCLTLHGDPRRATDRERAVLPVCSHCDGSVERGNQDWSYQESLREAAGDD